MTLPITQAPLVAESQLRSLQARADSGDGDQQLLMEREIESLFASILIKTMRQTLDGDGLFPGDKSDALGSLFDQFMGAEMAQGGGIGVGRLLNTYAGHMNSEPS